MISAASFERLNRTTTILTIKSGVYVGKFRTMIHVNDLSSCKCPKGHRLNLFPGSPKNSWSEREKIQAKRDKRAFSINEKKDDSVLLVYGSHDTFDFPVLWQIW